MMESFDDEMLFGADDDHDILLPTITDDNEQQSQLGSVMTHSRSRKRSRASSALSMSQTSGHEGGSIDDLIEQLPTPFSTAKTSKQDAKVVLILPAGKRDRSWLIDRIEDIFAQQVDGILANAGHLSVLVKLRPKNPEVQSPVVRRFKFPGTSEKEAWRYTVFIRILELVHGALVTDNVITKRDIYYRDPVLFSKQAVVDRFVDDLAFTFGVPRMLMNVTATAKGLIAGRFTIFRNDGATTDGRSEREGLLITVLKDGERINVDHVKWVLVVEKEATFRSLVSSSFWDRLSSHGLLVTGKGFPDIATRILLRSICLPSKQNNFAQPLIFCLVDYDPDGMDILSTYKHGSTALAHEKADLALPCIQWLGLDSTNIGQGEDLHQNQGLLRLSARDRRKAARMLEREVFMKDEPEWRRELQVMLMLNVKAEIQLLEAREGGLVRWLGGKGIS